MIREATKDDIDTIVELWKELMDFHKQREQRFTRSGNGHERFAEFVSGRIVHHPSCVLVAEEHEEIIGYCLATIGKFPPVFEYREHGAILDLAVTKHWRNKGIGQALVESILLWFSERDIHRVEVRVATSNEISVSFWKKMGFRPYVHIAYKEI